jgi:hypothetical protein
VLQKILDFMNRIFSWSIYLNYINGELDCRNEIDRRIIQDFLISEKHGNPGFVQKDTKRVEKHLSVCVLCQKDREKYGD